jgi:hypothetical protein
MTHARLPPCVWCRGDHLSAFCALLREWVGLPVVAHEIQTAIEAALSEPCASEPHPQSRDV